MVFKGKPRFEETPPDDFDPEHPYKDPVAFFEQRDYLAREKWVKIEKTRLVREQLKQCYLREGVNHFSECRSLVMKYMKLTESGLGWGKTTKAWNPNAKKAEAAEEEEE
jgi:NADH dehydrogenase (ubiquinone) 1 beta subcomplex subunit 10